VRYDEKAKETVVRKSYEAHKEHITGAREKTSKLKVGRGELTVRKKAKRQMLHVKISFVGSEHQCVPW